MQTFANWMASILRGPGEFLREATLAIPLSVAKGIFVGYFVILLVWVLTMRRSEVIGNVPGTNKTIDLRPYAAAALIGQILIYLIF